MEKIFEQNLLYDFYGELLTPHQQHIYEDAVYNDMSLSEIAEEQGISRQGVHDLIKRCDKILQNYESKLHLVERFMGAKEKIREIETLTQVTKLSDANAEVDRERAEVSEMDIDVRMQRIRELAGELMKEW
ncbi:MAG: DNA-binding protein [Lachnospiraceae bacterium]|nr:DNA-binding protein [Lachnospiraceae bacterium]